MADQLITDADVVNALRVWNDNPEWPIDVLNFPNGIPQSRYENQMKTMRKCIEAAIGHLVHLR